VLRAASREEALVSLYQTLMHRYGHQAWWPARTRFEVLVGAILTQNTAWRNVEKAVENLRSARCLSARGIERVELHTLRELIRPSGCFKQKADRLKGFCIWFRRQDGFTGLGALDTQPLRRALLEVKGIGPETADAMLLYGFDRGVFISDAYARRILSRTGLYDVGLGYDALSVAVMADFGGPVAVWQELHALLVAHAKQACKKRPDCAQCCLRQRCASCTV